MARKHGARSAATPRSWRCSCTSTAAPSCAQHARHVIDAATRHKEIDRCSFLV
jgi:hypothetical protein